MNYAIILAGGVGSRFWPLSRDIEPKQFLNLWSTKPMIEETLCRIKKIVKKENIYIATNKLYMQQIRKCTKDLDIPLNNFLFEPEGKNTFAPISILSHRINFFDPEAIIVVLPCDHFVKKTNRFLDILNKAINIARRGYIVTLGIKPKRPETGYGYIKATSECKMQKVKRCYIVKKFIEKPKVQSARRFIKDKNYWWNSGIFIFRPQVMLNEAKRFIPTAYNLIIEIKNNNDLKRLWHRLPSLSIDNAIMERTDKLALISADFGWIDIGSWQAIEEIIKKDKNGNISKGNHIDLESSNTTVWAGKRPVATLGLKGIIIVDSKPGLLVCSKDKTQDVKKIVQALKKRKSGF